MAMASQSELVKKYSSSEVYYDSSKDHVVVSIAVPVPDGFEVKFLDVEVKLVKLQVDFLPPVEVTLIKLPPEEDQEYSAHINCLWLCFAQMKLVAYALNRVFDKGCDLEANVDALLSCGLEIFRSLHLTSDLDLTWRNPTVAGGRLNFEAKEFTQRKSAPLRTYMCIAHPKNTSVHYFLTVHDDHKKRDRFVRGQAGAKCSIGALCTGEDVCSARLLQSCRADVSHVVCLPCLVGYFRNCPDVQPKCSVYGCYTRLDCYSLAQHLRNDKPLYESVIYTEHRRELARTMGSEANQTCPRCQFDNGPKSFLNHHQISYCRQCHQCWRESCLQYDPDTGGKFNYKCLFAIGAFIADSEDTTDLAL